MSALSLPPLPVIPHAEVRHISWAYGYCISSDGRLYTCWSGGKYRKLNPRWKRLKGSKNIRMGHMVSSINSRHYYLHRLVLEAFIGPCPPGMEGCHKDGNPQNNHIDNLRWDTRLGNMRDMVIHGHSQRGERSPYSKLTDEKVIQIRILYANGHTQQEIATMFNTARATISIVVNGKSWKHLPVMKNSHKKTHKLSQDQKIEICRMRQEKISLSIIAQTFNIDKSYIWYLEKKMTLPT